MIKALSIRAFKSLAEVDISLGHVNVFVGANGTGKSNLLESVGILGAAAEGRVDDAALIRRGVRPGIPTLYKSAFEDTKSANSISFQATTDAAHYKVGIFTPNDDPQSTWRFFSEDLTNRGTVFAGRSPRNASSLGQAVNLNDEAGYAALKAVELDKNEPASLLLKDLREYAVYAPNTPTLRGLVPDPAQRDPVGLAGGRLPDAVDELLVAGDAEQYPTFDVRQDVMSLVDWVDDIETVPTTDAPLSRAVPNVGRTALLFHDRYMQQALTAADASEGALYVLFAAVMAAHPRSPFIFAIDNFDHGLNPRLAKRLAQCFTWWCLHYNRQAFLTAHSPQVLDGLPLNDPRVRLFALDRTSRGRTSVNAIDVARVLDEKAKNGGATLSQLWLSGVLGGMPSV